MPPDDSAYTDAEWLLPSGKVVVLEVDGGFHMEVAHWEGDIARERDLVATGAIVLRCTDRELIDEPAASRLPSRRRCRAVVRLRATRGPSGGRPAAGSVVRLMTSTGQADDPEQDAGVRSRRSRSGSA